MIVRMGQEGFSPFIPFHAIGEEPPRPVRGDGGTRPGGVSVAPGCRVPPVHPSIAPSPMGAAGHRQSCPWRRGGRMVSGVLYEVVRHLGDAELWRYDIWTLATGYDMD